RCHSSPRATLHFTARQAGRLRHQPRLHRLGGTLGLRYGFTASAPPDAGNPSMSFFRRGQTESPAATPPGVSGEPPADETPVGETTGAVPGERGIPSINRVRSVQSRVSSVLTVTLLCALAVGLLVWYYSGAINRSARAQQLAQAAAKRRAQGDS